MSNIAAPAINVAAIIEGIISSAVVVFFEPDSELFILISVNFRKKLSYLRIFCAKLQN
jgi:hypothetical protein